MSVLQGNFKDLMSYQCSSVAIVGVVNTTELVGLTVSSFQSISIAPPIVSFCLSDSTKSSPAVRATRYVGISLLSSEQVEIGVRYSTAGTKRFLANEFFFGPEGVPLIRDAVFHLAASIDSVSIVGSSQVFFGRVVWGEFSKKTMPLRYWRREFIGG
jgi:flavin reductase (DIM6/NTAB) family NADH-FMN oxidoreductase RutF